MAYQCEDREGLVGDEHGCINKAASKISNVSGNSFMTSGMQHSRISSAQINFDFVGSILVDFQVGPGENSIVDITPMTPTGGAVAQARVDIQHTDSSDFDYTLILSFSHNSMLVKMDSSIPVPSHASRLEVDTFFLELSYGGKSITRFPLYAYIEM